jgi:hypothetical protein
VRILDKLKPFFQDHEACLVGYLGIVYIEGIAGLIVPLVAIIALAYTWKD